MVVAALVLYALARDGVLGAADGILLLLGGVVYTGGILYAGRRDPDPVGAGHMRGPPERGSSLVRLVIELVIGVAAILIGAQLLVGGAEIAHALGVSETVIGLTIVAIGTTAPELVTTLVSTFRGERDLAIDNLLGSSVYNVAVILGLTVVVAPAGVPVPAEVIASDLVLLVAATVIAVPVMLTGARIGRAEGGLFVVRISRTSAGSWPPAPRSVGGS